MKQRIRQVNRREVLRGLGAGALLAGVPGEWLAGSTKAEAETMKTADQAKKPDLNKVLPEFSEGSRKRLQELVSATDFDARIPAADVKAIAANEGKTVDALMMALLPLARTLSRPPISQFLVGAVTRGASGSLYLGANLEIAGQALGFTVHAEQSAIAAAYMHAEKGIETIAVTAAPCGHCRQFMNELSPHSKVDILVKDRAATTLAALLPESFGPGDLGRKDGAFPVQSTSLKLSGNANALATAALEAARMSYAPYSKSPSGVAIESKSGRTFKGSYIENAAFNPSLPPLQTALLALIAAGEDFATITNVALCELGGSTISQKSPCEAVLASIAPGVKLQRVAASV